MGLRQTDSKFTDLASTLWKEICQSSDPELLPDTLRRMARVLASGDADQIQGKTPAQRMKSLAKLLNQQQIPANEPAVPEALVTPSRGITPERLKAVSQMIKTIGGFGRLREILVVIKEVGGVTKLKDWLDTMEMDEPDDVKL